MKSHKFHTTHDCPLGPLFLQGDGERVTGLFLQDHKGWSGPDADSIEDERPFRLVRTQLDEYFAGKRQAFDLAIHFSGTKFQRQVWHELTKIPFGKTISYAELAKRVGNPLACRAVGAANGRNPISIIVPCHRVISGDGRPAGYAGGIDKKLWLLDWERSAR